MYPATANLSPEELGNPTTAFTGLFDAIHLSVLQETMWTGLKAMVTRRYKQLTSAEKELQLEV